MRIEWQNKARKQIKKLGNPQAVLRILTAIDDYAAGKACDIKALSEHEYTHRLRVGDYRVLMVVDEAIEISLIEEVKKRDERTY